MDTEYYCFGCQRDMCIQNKKLHVVELSSKHYTVTRYVDTPPPQKKKKSKKTAYPNSHTKKKSSPQKMVGGLSFY